MIDLKILKSVKFVVGQDGRPSAVQMDIRTWESLLDWLETTDDRALVKQVVPKLRRRSARTAHWDDVEGEWDDPEV